jgi:hypothetical protein
VKKYFEWFEKNYSILSPTFSHSGKEIAFAKQFQYPEGPSAPEGYFDSVGFPFLVQFKSRIIYHYSFLSSYWA